MGGGYWKTDTVWCWQRIACASVVKISFGEIIDRWDREVAHLFIIEGAEEPFVGVVAGETHGLVERGTRKVAWLAGISAWSFTLIRWLGSHTHGIRRVSQNSPQAIDPKYRRAGQDVSMFALGKARS